MRGAARWATAIAAAWAGVLLAIAFLAAPAAFATLPGADAGRVVGRLFAFRVPGALLFGSDGIRLDARIDALGRDIWLGGGNLRRRLGDGRLGERLVGRLFAGALLREDLV